MESGKLKTYIEEEYKKRKKRLTVATRQIIHILGKSKRALTQQEILKKLQKNNPNVNITTVYRVLDRLLEIKAIHDINGRFKTCEDPYNTSEAHHFLICKKCGKYEEIFLDYTESMAQLLMKEKGFAFSHAEMIFYGTCNECISKGEAQSTRE